MNGLQRVPDAGAEGAEELNTFGCPSPGHTLSSATTTRLPARPVVTSLNVPTYTSAARVGGGPGVLPPGSAAEADPTSGLPVCMSACMRACIRACMQARAVNKLRAIGLLMYPRALVVPTRPFVHAAAQGIRRLISLSLIIFCGRQPSLRASVAFRCVCAGMAYTNDASRKWSQ